MKSTELIVGEWYELPENETKYRTIFRFFRLVDGNVWTDVAAVFDEKWILYPHEWKVARVFESRDFVIPEPKLLDKIKQLLIFNIIEES